MPPQAPPNSLPPTQARLAIATIVIAVFMASLDTSIANTALPTIAADLRASPAASVWVVNAYQLAMVALLLPLSALGEIIGFRRVYSVGLVVFTAASLLCALSWSLPTLTAARVLQGLGAAGVMSVNTALIRFIYPPHRLGRGVGFNALVVAVSFAMGPSVAALILSVAAWPMLFAINVPAGLLAAALAWRALPETPRDPRRFDAPGAALCAVGFAAIIFTVGEATHRATPLETAAAALLAVAAIALLIRRERNAIAPLIPVDLYRRPLFALSSATSICAFTAQGLSFVSLPFLFQAAMGHTPTETGILLTPWPVATAALAPIAGPLSDKVRPALLGGFGLLLLCAGLLSMALLPEGTSDTGIMARLLLCGAGFGLFQSPNLKAIMSAAPPGRSGGASGTIAISRLMGQSMGAALVALCFGLVAAATPGITHAAEHASTAAPLLALALAATFAGIGCVISFSRLLAR